MEDGPKLLPQWLRGSSSALHHRGDTLDASKRGKPAVGPDSARSGAPTDPWLQRGGSAGPSLNTGSGAAPGKVPQEFTRAASDRGGLGERSWKARDHGYPSASSRSGYVPAGLKPNGRDDRDRDVISLKPGGGYSASRSYGRPAELEGGGVGGGSGRLDRVGQDGWQLSRTTSTGGGTGGGRRDDDDTRSPLRTGVVANGGAHAGSSSAVPSKASFETDFPSLRPSTSAAPGAVSPSPHPGALSAAASAPQLAASSPLLDTASSANALAPYRQTFLSSRTSSNWTSKLAEAPAAPSISPSSTPSPSLSQPIPAVNPTEEESLAAPMAASTPSPSPGPPAVATSAPAAGVVPPVTSTPTPMPAAPVPVVPPRPSGVWGTPAAAAAVAAAAESHVNVSSATGAPIPTTRARMEHLAVRQSKQLIPVISSGAGKPKSGGAGGGGGSSMQGLGMASGGVAGTGVVGGSVGVGGSRVVGGVPKPVVPTAGLLKMSAGKRDEPGAGTGAVAGGTRVLASTTVILSKKASQPLDRPLTLTRTSSASAPVAPALAPTPVAGSAATGSAAPIGDLGSSGAATGDSVGANRARADATASEAVAVDSPAARQPQAASCDPSSDGDAQVAQGAASSQESGLAVAPQPPQQDGQAPPPPPQQQQQQEQRGAPTSIASHPALQVSEEEEAFLRSLGWTGFDEEDGDGEDTGLTEEEIAAFRAEQQRQQAAAAVAAGPLAAAAAAPKPVPALAARRRGKPLIVAASYGSEQVSSSTDSDSECE